MSDSRHLEQRENSDGPTPQHGQGAGFPAGGPVEARLDAALLGVAAALGALFLLGAFFRLTAPFDLEWMEGGMAMHAWRLRQGLPLYTAPDLTWVPFIYPPAYAVATATLGGLLDDDRLAGRLLSLAATLGSAVVLYAVTHRKTANRQAGLLAGSLFLATYPLSGYWFDLARVDSLGLFLSVAALALLCDERVGSLSGELARGAGAALLMAASVLTKQTALALAVALLVPAWQATKSRALTYGLVVTGILVTTTGILQRLTGGLFLTYVVEVPSAHGAPVGRALASLAEMGRGLPVAAIAVLALPFLAGFGIAARTPRSGTGETGQGPRASSWLAEPYLLPGLTVLVSTIWARAHSGSYDNVFMPVHWFGVFVLAVVWAQSRQAPASVRRVLAIALLFQCGLCFYNPARVMPGAEDAAATRELEDLLSRAPGPVFFPDRPLAVTAAGLPPHAHSMALSDVERAGLSHLPAVNLDDAYRQKKFAAVIVRPDWITKELEAHYVVAPSITARVRSAPFPITGWHSKQLHAFRPRTEAEAIQDPD